MKARRAMVEPEENLSVRRQCELVQVCRSGLYYKPEPTPQAELVLMRRIDELHLKFPFYGSRKLTQQLKRQGLEVNRKRVVRLMRVMDMVAVAPKPNTSRPAPEHAVFPYLLRNVKVHRVNQVWAADITYIPMTHGFVYLVAIMDWYSRRVLSWRVSTTLGTDFCLDALREALGRFGTPDIFNTDQGAQFTDERFTSELLGRNIKVSMDGKGRYTDNIFVERLWRSLKYEEVYLHAYDSILEARKAIEHYLRFYNQERVHQALGYQCPANFYDTLKVAA